MRVTTKQRPNLGRLIRDAREQKKLDTAELARQAEVEKSYMYRIEAGQVPSRKALARIARACGVTDERSFSVWLAEAGYQQGPVGVAPAAGSADEALVTVDSSALPRDNVVGFYDRIRKVLESIPGLSTDDLAEIKPKLKRILDRVETVWEGKGHQLARQIPSRGLEHNVRIIEALCANCIPELKTVASTSSAEPLRTELLRFMGGVLLHDVSLAQCSDEATLKDLDRYHESSARYVTENQMKLGLSDSDKSVVADLCRYHRHVSHLKDLQDQGVSTATLRLLCLFRLAALLEVRQERVTEGNLLPFKIPIPIDLECELLRNLFVTRIRIDRAKQALIASLCCDWEQESFIINSLRDRIESDLHEALALIRDTLLVDLNRPILWAKTEPDASHLPPAPIAQQIQMGMQLVSTSRSPNAARVIDILLRSLVDQSTLTDIRAELESYKRLRSYQAQIPNLFDDLQEILKPEGNGSLSNEEKLQQVRRVVQWYDTCKKKAYEYTAATARKTFTDPARFMLYGFSQCVIHALANLSDDVKKNSYVYVLEGRPKAHHGQDGSIQYCDGIEYARELCRSGYAHVVVMPDGSATYVLLDSDVEPGGALAVHVLLGAEGISPSGDVASTIGTMLAVISAKYACDSGKRVSVYVLAERGKIREPEPKPSSDLRDNHWLTSGQKIEKLKDEEGIEVRNVINENVPRSLITGFIGLCERGPISSAEIEAVYQEHRREFKNLFARTVSQS